MLEGIKLKFDIPQRNSYLLPCYIAMHRSPLVSSLFEDKRIRLYVLSTALKRFSGRLTNNVTLIYAKD